MIFCISDQVVFLSFKNGTEPTGSAKLRAERRWRGSRRYHSTSLLDLEDSPPVFTVSQPCSQTAEPAATEPEPEAMQSRHSGRDRALARSSSRVVSSFERPGHDDTENLQITQKVPKQQPKSRPAKSAAGAGEVLMSADNLAQVWRRRVGKGEESAASFS